MLVLISGLPGSGKSAIATLLAAHLRTPALSRDWARSVLGERFLVPRAVRQRLANGLLLALVDKLLLDDCPALVELVAEKEMRLRLRESAVRHGKPYRQIECVCADRAELLRRLARRPGDWAAVLRRTEQTYLKPSPGTFLELDTTLPPEELAARAALFLGPRNSW